MNSLQLDKKAIEILKNVFGFSDYRYGQKEIVENILSIKLSPFDGTAVSLPILSIARSTNLSSNYCSLIIQLLSLGFSILRNVTKCRYTRVYIGGYFDVLTASIIALSSSCLFSKRIFPERKDCSEKKSSLKTT
jgi:hypothetical protein